MAPASPGSDDRRFNRLAVGGMAVGFVLLVIGFAATLFSFGANQRATDLVRHTYQVTDTLSRLNLQLERAEGGRRGYLLAPTPYRLGIYESNVKAAPQTLDRIAFLTSDNPVEVHRMPRLRSLVAAEIRDLELSIRRQNSGQGGQAVAAFKAQGEQSAIRQIRALTSAIRATELDLLAKRSASLQATLGLVRLILALTGLLLLVTAAITFQLVRRFVRNIGQARDELSVLNTDLEGQVRLRTVDLQRANDEIQRFAYIVSHDLRSPLVNVLGFTAELDQANKTIGDLIERAEREAPQVVTDDVRNAREELPEAIGFIRSSTAKMDRLINAILKLSREGRRNLTPEPLAMAAIVRDIVAAMEHRLTETDATVTIEEPMPDLVSDRVAIEQIFSNLIENAVKYAEPGRPGRIVVRGRRAGERLIYDVEDNGRGIDAKDHERVFDLFRRSGKQDQPGEGIGLAHVRALAYRLGGFIDLKSEIGEGATFQVNLPVTYHDQGVDS